MLTIYVSELLYQGGRAQCAGVLNRSKPYVFIQKRGFLQDFPSPKSDFALRGWCNQTMKLKSSLESSDQTIRPSLFFVQESSFTLTSSNVTPLRMVNFDLIYLLLHYLNEQRKETISDSYFFFSSKSQILKFSINVFYIPRKIKFICIYLLFCEKSLNFFIELFLRLDESIL